MIDPSTVGFIGRIRELHPDFEDAPAFQRIKPYQLFEYIILTYDKESPFVIKYNDWMQRRREVVKAVGFKTRKGKYSREVEKLILGGYPQINQMIVRYLFLQNDIEFIKFNSYQAMYFRQVKESIEKDFAQPGHYDKLKKNIDILSVEIRSIEKMIFHGEEKSEELKKELYNFVSKISYDFKPEDIAEKKQDGEDIVDEKPYPDEYTPDELKFIGDE
jgi:hypothetical protein